MLKRFTKLITKVFQAIRDVRKHLKELELRSTENSYRVASSELVSFIKTQSLTRYKVFWIGEDYIKVVKLSADTGTATNVKEVK